MISQLSLSLYSTVKVYVNCSRVKSAIQWLISVKIHDSSLRALSLLGPRR